MFTCTQNKLEWMKNTLPGMQVTLDEYKKLTKSRNYNESISEDTFKLPDKEKVGKIKRSKLIEMEFHFWFVPGQDESEGILDILLINLPKNQPVSKQC